MKKEILTGLIALLLGCGKPVPITPTEPIFVYSSQARHRGVPITGVIYRDIQIIGPENYTGRQKHSLDRLSQTPFWNFVHQNVTTIRYNPPSCVHLEKGIYDTDEDLKTSENNQPEAWIDSEKIHEACHVNQYKTRRESWGHGAERECMLWQNVYLLHVGAADLLVDVEQQLKKRYWEKKDQWW